MKTFFAITFIDEDNNLGLFEDDFTCTTAFFHTKEKAEERIEELKEDGEELDFGVCTVDLPDEVLEKIKSPVSSINK